MSDAALRVSFGALYRGPVHVQRRLDTPLETFGQFPVELGPVDVRLEVRGNPREGVRAVGRVSATAAFECRRCLRPIRAPIRADVDVWFRAVRSVTPGEDGVWPYAATAAEIDLVPVIREELLLAIPNFPVCRDACVGLCPSCGVRLEDESCSCPPPEPDPRWGALADLSTP
ncbi:MAG: DUF177 domain-containing protein [Gemmatimonadota bacterium]